MNKEQAMQVVGQALSLVKATQQEHQVINKAMQYINTLVEAPVKEVKKNETK